jgi:DNA polymerase III delta prime subunit
LTKPGITRKEFEVPLHTDYRPTKLLDIVGNRETVHALKAHLQKKSPNRSLLFTGPSGCGKTTLAICIANELGSYDDWNFQMLNASDFRGIDTVRELREQAGRRPLGAAKTRIWLMDECHKLTQDAQEAILKLLEEPPPNCWFLLATTNPEKLKVTLRRRCTEFPVNPVTSQEVDSLLLKVARKEGKRVGNEVLRQICQDCLGSLGIALNILDKVIDLPQEDMLAHAKSWAERTNNVITLCRHFLKSMGQKGGWKETLVILKDLQGEDPEGVRRAVLEYFNKVGLDGNEKAYLVMACFRENYYDVGRAGLYMSCYELFNGE